MIYLGFLTITDIPNLPNYNCSKTVIGTIMIFNPKEDVIFATFSDCKCSLRGVYYLIPQRTVDNNLGSDL